MKVDNQKFRISLSCYISVVFGCNEFFPIDDQSHVPKEISALVNPVPMPRDFLKNNKRHKVLIAVIDTGVDYIHPAHLDNFHFYLDFNRDMSRK